MDLNITHHLLDGFTVSDNTPSIGYIQWADLHVVYEGVSYSITNGSSNKKYVYWDKSVSTTALQGSDTLPTLTDDDFIVFLNKSGTHVTVSKATAVEGSLIVPESILTDALAANCVTADKVLAGAIIAEKMAADSVGTNNIITGAITASKIASGAVDTDQLNTGSVTADKIDTGAVTADKIGAGAITGEKIAINTITANKIVANTITANEIAGGTITETELAASIQIIQIVATLPASPYDGQTVRLTTDNHIYQYQTAITDWKDLSEASGDPETVADKDALNVASYEGKLVYDQSEDLVYFSNGTGWINTGLSASDVWSNTTRKLTHVPLSATWWGSGVDGDLTVSSDTEITNVVKHYNNLTINTGYKLYTQRGVLVIYVKGTLTLNGTIEVGNEIPGGVGGPSTMNNPSQPTYGQGGDGGKSGGLLIVYAKTVTGTGTLKATGGNGVNGYNNLQYYTSSGSAVGIDGEDGIGAQWEGYVYPAPEGGIAGKTPSTESGFAGSAPDEIYQLDAHAARYAYAAQLAGLPIPSGYGSSGGGGGSGSGSNATLGNGCSGGGGGAGGACGGAGGDGGAAQYRISSNGGNGGGGGGGGGGAGGIILLASSDNNATITANVTGGNGGDGGVGYRYGSGGGAGGGGSGGVVVTIADVDITTKTVTGGTGGTGGADGSLATSADGENGDNGESGLAYFFTINDYLEALI